MWFARLPFGAKAYHAGRRLAARRAPRITTIYNRPVISRASWPVRRYRLGEEPGDDLSRSTTAEERLAMMPALADEAWSLTGRPFPTYARHEAPVVRRHWRVSPPR